MLGETRNPGISWIIKSLWISRRFRRGMTNYDTVPPWMGELRRTIALKQKGLFSTIKNSPFLKIVQFAYDDVQKNYPILNAMAAPVSPAAHPAQSA
jgi:hypothetical protein